MKAETPKIISRLISSNPSLKKYINIVEVCYEYDTSAPECQEADYEWECPCVLSKKEVRGELPRDAFLSVAPSLTVEEARALLRYVRGLEERPHGHPLCEAGGYAVFYSSLPHEVDVFFDVYKVVNVKVRDGELRLYERADSLPAEAAAECLRRAKEQGLAAEFAREMAAEGRLPRELARQVLPLREAPEYLLRRLAEAGVYTREEVLEELRRRAAERPPQVDSPEAVERARREAEEELRKARELVDRVNSIAERLRRELEDLPVIVNVIPEPRIDEKWRDEFCLEGEWVVDEEKLRLEWRCTRRETISRYELNTTSFEIRVFTTGYLKRDEFQRYLNAVKSAGLKFCREEKVWALELTPEGPRNPCRHSRSSSGGSSGHSGSRRRRQRRSWETDLGYDYDYDW